MNAVRTIAWRGLVLVSLVGLLWSSENLSAQKPPPPVAPNPQAPVLALAAPLGMQRGTTLALTLTGTNLAGPTGLSASFPVTITIPTDNKNGADNTKLRVQLEVPADAPLGYHAIRLATTRGISNIRLFCIDDLAQVMKVDTAKNKMTPQAVAYPAVVVGRVDNESSDWYKISVQAGQRVSFDLLGRRLGGPIDAQLSIYHPKTQRELAHENDSPGCQTDPRLTYTFKEAGEYLIEVRDVLNRGGADYVYRLRIGDFPCATVPVPLAIARDGAKQEVRFAGPVVEGVAPVTPVVPSDPSQSTIWVTPKGANGLSGWPVALTLSDHAELLEQEPNNEPAKANRIPIPGGVTGRFEKSDDSDFYVFSAKKGQRLLIEAQTLELHSPTLVYMILKNAKTGADLAKTKPDVAPPLDQRLEFTAPDDGDFLLEVQHLNYLGGPSEVYRVTVTPADAGFDLSLGIDRYDVAPGSALSLPIFVTRRGYMGPIQVSVDEKYGLKGEVTIPAGKAAKPNQVGAVLQLNVGKEMPLGPYALAVQGTATIDGRKVTQYASVRTTISASLGNLPFPPRHLVHTVAVAVKERAPFSLAVRFEPKQVLPGTTTNVIITATRDPGFEEAIVLNPPAGLPPTIPTPALKPIAKGQNEVTLQLKLTPKTAFGDILVTFSGKSKASTKEYITTAAPALLTVTRPFDLKITPSPLKLAPGITAKLTITAMRKAGYDGPIAIEVRNLPANVTAPKTMIAKGENSVELAVAAADGAVPGSKIDVNILGVASAAGNVQVVSPNFTVIVDKK
jgi:hypothetical protein